MEPSNLPQSFLDRFTTWMRESILLKLTTIGFIILVLMIPKSMVNSLIDERLNRSVEVENEVSNTWSKPQTMTGPILMVPWIQKTVQTTTKGEVVTTTEKNYFFVAAESCETKAVIDTETLKRGIYEVVLYKSMFTINAKFPKADLVKLNISPEKVDWKNARIVVGLADVRGISGDFKLMLDKQELKAEASQDIGISYAPAADQSAPAYSTREPNVLNSGVVAAVELPENGEYSGDLTLQFTLKGSKDLNIIPSSGTTAVHFESTWPSPKFIGSFAADDRTISAAGFQADWKILHFNRPFSPQWHENTQQLSGYSLGTTLLLPVDQYHQSTRSSKYGILIILVTFLALFLVETTNKLRIHPFQYILIGVGLVIYYTLLLSFSEHLGFELAYIIASVATTVLVTIYTISFFERRMLTWLVGGLLAAFYGLIYLIIQEEDYSLLLGSVGLFLLLAATMYFSRKIKWN